MANTYTLISSVTVGSGGAASIDFTSIPSTYTDLVLKVSSRDDRSGQPNGDLAVQIGLNGTINTGSIYSTRRLYGASTFTGSDSISSAASAGVGMSDSSTATANTFSNNELYFPNYAGSTNKSFSVDGVSENNSSSGGWQILNAGLAATTNAITDIRLTSFFGTAFAQYTTAYLYGISNA